MTKVQELYQWLSERGASIGGVTIGHGNPSAEQLAETLLDSLQAIDRGEFEVMAEIGEDDES